MTARTFSDVKKDLTAASVHTPTALGNDRKRKGAKTFRSFVGETPVTKRDSDAPAHTITLELNEGDHVKPLAQFLSEVAHRAAVGHSFALEADREDGDRNNYPRTGIDGDGGSYITRVLMDGQEMGRDGELKKRALHPHDAATAKTPFLYDCNALGSLRPDQVPRFFGALTDSDKLDDAELPLADLVAMQDRVDPDKVESMAAADLSGGKKPVVVRHNGKNLIADGHHRLAADWLNGKEKAQVKFKDLTDVSNALKAMPDQFRVAKVDETLGLVFGWAIVCKMDGQDYFDWNVDAAGEHKGKLVPEHITEDAMLKCGLGFALTKERAGNEQHAGPDVGTYPFIFPMTTDIAKAFGIQTNKTGLMIAYKPPKDVLAKFLSGEYTGFSAEGFRVPGGSVEHD